MNKYMYFLTHSPPCLLTLENQLIYANIDDFYYLSRATLVKDEKHYDKFDKAFEIYFKGIERMEDVFQALIPEDWLRKAFEKHNITYQKVPPHSHRNN